MAKTKNTVFAIALLAMFALLVCMMSVSPSLARYENIPIGGIVYEQPKTLPVCDLLFENGGNVDLGLCDSHGMTINLTFSIPEGCAEGTVSCSHSSEYLSITFNGEASCELEIDSSQQENVVFSISLQKTVSAPIDTVVRVLYNYNIDGEEGELTSDFKIRLVPDNSNLNSWFTSENYQNKDIFINDGCAAISKDLILLRFERADSLDSKAVISCSYPFNMVAYNGTLLYSGNEIYVNLDTGYVILDISKNKTLSNQEAYEFKIIAQGDVLYADTVAFQRSALENPFDIRLSGVSAPILSSSEPLVFEVEENPILTDSDWTSVSIDDKPELIFSIERFTADGWQTDDDCFGISVGIIQASPDEEPPVNGSISLSADKSHTDAGTYRLVAELKYGTTQIYKKSIPFFIDYR